jgi:hypothetical protein
MGIAPRCRGPTGGEGTGLVPGDHRSTDPLGYDRAGPAHIEDFALRTPKDPPQGGITGQLACELGTDRAHVFELGFPGS